MSFTTEDGYCKRVVRMFQNLKIATEDFTETVLACLRNSVPIDILKFGDLNVAVFEIRLAFRINEVGVIHIS